MKAAAFLSILYLLLATIASSQTNDEGLAFLQLNFFNPGARALGMGGAFIGMADDATAALANPGGLTILIKPEASIELSAPHYTNQIPWTAGYWNNHENGCCDFHYQPSDFPATTTALSFFSFVYPLIKERFVLSGFFNQETNFKRNYQTQGMNECFDDGSCQEDAWPDANSSLHLKIKNLGFSASFKPQDRISLGATLNAYELRLNSTNTEFCGNSGLCTDPNGVVRTTTLSGDDNRIGYTLGMLARLNRNLSVGFVYIKRPDFHVVASIFWAGVQSSPRQHSESLKIPDSIAAGISIKPIDRFSINVDLYRIFYSQFMDGYYNTYYIPDSPFPEPIFTDPKLQRSVLEISDATEFRIGGEYILLAKTPVAVRAGYWREPFQGIVNTFNDQHYIFTVDDIIDPFFSRTFIQSFNHVTAGAGIVFKQFTIDGAYDYSRNSKRLLLSTVLYLDRLTK